MSHADQPYPTRPLAGVDQALGEGRARQPVELLDQLRERLDRLDPIHPSASRRPEAATSAETGDSGVAAESGEVTESGDGTGSQDSQRGDAAPVGQESRDQLRQNRAVARDDGERPGGGERPDGLSADQPEAQPSVGYSLTNGPVTDGEFGAVDGVRADKGERYRPWFAADEPASPWFVE